MRAKNKRLTEIEFFRAAACLLIVGFHWCSALYDMEIIDKNYMIWGGEYGVPFLFVLSSFFLYKKTQNAESKPIDLFVNRVFRLYPSYWLCVIFSSIFLLFCRSENAPTIGQVIVNFTMLQRIVGVEDVDGVYWTLTYELFLAVFMAFLCIKIKRKATCTTQAISPIRLTDESFSVCIAWLLFCAAARGICSVLGVISNAILLLLLGSRFVCYFVLGIACCNMKYNSKKFNKRKWIIVLILSCIYEAIFGGLVNVLVETIIIILSLILFSGKIKINIGVFNFIASISYEIYLLHSRIGREIFYKFCSKNSVIGNTITIILTFIFIIITAFLIKKASNKITLTLSTVYRKISERVRNDLQNT